MRHESKSGFNRGTRVLLTHFATSAPLLSPPSHPRHIQNKQTMASIARRFSAVLLRAAAFISFLLLASIVPVARGDSGSTSIRGKLLLPDGAPLTNSTRVVINDGEHSTYSQADGSFVLHHVGPGIHSLTVHSAEHHFAMVKIQLLKEETESDSAESLSQPKCIQYPYPGAPKQPIAYPLELTALAQYLYFEERPKFSVMRIFKNPMMLMMLVSVGLMLFMPKMMEGLDDEQREQMRQQMQMQQNMATDPGKALSQFLSGGDMGEESASGSSSQRRMESSKAGGKTARRGKRD